MRNIDFELRDAIRRENWSIRGPNCIVKVCPLYSLAGSINSAASHGGYITLGRFLIGKTPYQIEIALGLESNKITGGAKIYKFKRLPLLSEVEYDLTADHPGGLHYNPAHSNPKYLPGAPHIHQWQIEPGVRKIKPRVLIPVDELGALVLKQGQVFPYSWLAT